MQRDPARVPAGAWGRPGSPGRPAGQPVRLAPAPGAIAPRPSSQPLGRLGVIALVVAVASGLITHGYHLFEYPLYSTDEGIYVERAWAVVREGRLSPETYYYDHAPGGWILLAFWEWVLPSHFETFGNPVNSGRVLMLLLHAASVYFLFEIARKLSGGLLAPMIATFFFNFSPLGIYYQRMVLLDNIMVFWVLLSIYLLLRRESQLFTGMWSGLALGIAVVTKENAIFFAPAIFYLLSRRAKADPNRRFAMMLWVFTASAPILIYFLLAILKGELLPAGLDFNLNEPPQGHVSLLYEMWYQVHRNQGTLFTPGSFLYSAWLPKDAFLLAAGTAAMLINLVAGWRERQRDPSLLVAAGLALGIACYLARGSVILDFYVIPVIPLYALNIALLADRILKRLPAHRLTAPAFSACLAALLLLPSGGYLLTHGQRGQLQPADVYYLPLTYLQQEQIAWIRLHIPPGDTIITDDDIWVALHDIKPYYPYAWSHWNAATDPQVRNNIFGAKWQNIDYIVLSNGMRQAMIGNNAGGAEAYILNALDNHSVEVWQASRGNVQLAIYKVQH
jgi:4-amino-4-deoxy-L-arabinose transferase-like glycosyltransferase